MVRMLGSRSISLSRLCDNGIRLTHPRLLGAKLPVNVRERVRNGRADAGQPAFAASQPMGSTSPPLTLTSKCRWLAVERPVLPTKPMS